MKRRFAILLTALLLLSGEGAAQLIRSFGVKAGAVTATQSYDYENSPDLTSLGMDYRWGVVAGVFARTGSLSLFSLSAEVMYIQKGFRTEALVASPSFPDGWGETITITPRADYLSIPVFLHAGFDAAALSPYLFAGPRLDFLVYRNRSPRSVRPSSASHWAPGSRSTPASSPTSWSRRATAPGSWT
jgi:hypothetical protein